MDTLVGTPNICVCGKTSWEKVKFVYFHDLMITGQLIFHFLSHKFMCEYYAYLTCIKHRNKTPQYKSAEHVGSEFTIRFPQHLALEPQ